MKALTYKILKNTKEGVNTNEKTRNRWDCNTHTHGNLINNKKINAYTIFMCFLRRKNVHKNI